MSITSGIHHLGLSVSNLESAIHFFTGALGFTLTGRNDDYPAAFLKDSHSLITLWSTADDPTPFNRKKNEGLHHFAINITTLDTLIDLYHKLSEWKDVIIEKGITAMSPGSSTKHFFVRIPGGPRLELIANH